MRILCDQHVPTKYVQAFEQESWLTVSTVAEELAPDAADADIAAYAATERWVVFTSDSDFYRGEIPHGLLVYSQIEDPSPGAVIEAISTIDSVHASHDSWNRRRKRRNQRSRRQGKNCCRCRSTSQVLVMRVGDESQGLRDFCEELNLVHMA